LIKHSKTKRGNFKAAKGSN